MRSEEFIKSYVRLKPLAKDQVSILNSSRKDVVLNKTKEHYTFHEVFSDTATNQYIYDRVINPVLPDLFNGYNACILAYGQTNSGKTHTMRGMNKNLGMIPLCIKEIFKRIKDDELYAKVSISYYEIYNENLIDLLGDEQSKALEIRDDGKKNINIPDLKELDLKDQFEALSYYQKGELKRKLASNSVNLLSSRSHAIFVIRLSIVNELNQLAESCIHMVDLAGSQSISKTNATGQLKKESENINKSLLSLTTAIRAISEKQTFVNYRGSKLTRVLQQCLSGNSKTFVICTVKQTEDCISQTINTLKFGMIANTIKNELKQNIVETQQQEKQQEQSRYKSLLLILEQQRKSNAYLQQELLRKDRELESRMQQLQRIKREFQEAKHNYLVLQNSNRHNTNIIDYYKTKEEKDNTHRNLFLLDSQQSLALIETENNNLKGTISNLQQNIEYKNKKIATLQRNERGLLDRVEKYEEQLTRLQELMRSNQLLKQNQENMRNVQNKSYKPSEQSRYKPTDFHQITRIIPPENGLIDSCFTIGKLIDMSTDILSSKVQMNHYLRSITELHEEIYALQAKIQELSENKQVISPTKVQQIIQPPGSRRQSTNSRSGFDEKYLKKCEAKVERLKRENEILRRKNMQFLVVLKKSANTNIRALEGFNEYAHENFSHSKKQLFQFLTRDPAEDYEPIVAYATRRSRGPFNTQFDDVTRQESSFGPASQNL